MLLLSVVIVVNSESVIGAGDTSISVVVIV